MDTAIYWNVFLSNTKDSIEVPKTIERNGKSVEGEKSGNADQNLCFSIWKFSASFSSFISQDGSSTTMGTFGAQPGTLWYSHQLQTSQVSYYCVQADHTFYAGNVFFEI